MFVSVHYICVICCRRVCFSVGVCVYANIPFLYSLIIPSSLLPSGSPTRDFSLPRSLSPLPLSQSDDALDCVISRFEPNDLALDASTTTGAAPNPPKTDALFEWPAMLKALRKHLTKLVCPQ